MNPGFVYFHIAREWASEIDNIRIILPRNVKWVGTAKTL